MYRTASVDLQAKIDGHKSKIAENIKRLRDDKGMSREDFCFYARISYQTMRLIDMGTHNPTLSTLIQIADGLGVSLTQVLL